MLTRFYFRDYAVTIVEGKKTLFSIAIDSGKAELIHIMAY